MRIYYNIIAVIFMFSYSELFAQNSETITRQDRIYFEEIAGEMDYIHGKHFENPSDFWNYVRSGNKSLQKYEKKKNSGLKRKTIEQISDYKMKDKIADRYRPDNPYNNENIDSLLVYIKRRILGGDTFPNRVMLIDNDYINALTNTNGNFYIMGGLYDILSSPEELIFVLAHEYTHYILKHIEQDIYQDKKTRRRNNIIGGIAGGLAVAGTTYMASQSRYIDTELSVNVNNQIIKSTENMVDLYTLYSGYRYSREQEFEADYIAFNFMKLFGDTSFAISTLEKIYVATGMISDKTEKEDDHPSLLERIKFMKFLETWDGEHTEKEKNDDLYYIP